MRRSCNLLVFTLHPALFTLVPTLFIVLLLPFIVLLLPFMFLLFVFFLFLLHAMVCCSASWVSHNTCSFHTLVLAEASWHYHTNGSVDNNRSSEHHPMKLTHNLWIG